VFQRQKKLGFVRKQQIYVAAREFHDNVGSLEIVFGRTRVGDFILEVESSIAKDGF
jgi:hypothetical protein